jgi:hypothetical protein
MDVDGGEEASPQAAKADREGEGEGDGDGPASGGPAAAAAAAAAAQQPGVQLAPLVLEARKEGLTAHWEGLKQQIQVGWRVGAWVGAWSPPTVIWQLVPGSSPNMSACFCSFVLI